MKTLGLRARQGWVWRWTGVMIGTLALTCALPVGGQQPTAQSPLPEAPRTVEAERDYVIGPLDLLQISILESPELSRETRVGADGTVSLPLLDRVSLKGLTLAEAEDLLERHYREGGIVNDPHITISVKELHSKPVTVMGAVRSPGVFQVSGQSRLLRVLSQAGGSSAEAGSYVQIIRADPNGQEREQRIPMSDVVSGALHANVPIYGGDTVNVIPAGAVYVVGAVNHPGRHLLHGESEQTGILQVLALSGDLTRTAKAEKAVLIRKAPDGQLNQVPVDIRKILRKEAPDVAVMANDVLYVPDSLGKRAFARGLQSALQVASAIAVAGVI